MKSTAQIARECGISHNEINRLAVRDELKPIKVVKRNKFYDKHQEDYLHNILYLSGKITEITYQSKINIA